MKQKLIISFPDQSESFTNGVESGRILNKMENGKLFINNNGFPLHKKNIQVIKNMCKAYDYEPIFGKEFYDEWIQFFALKSYQKN